MIPLSQKLPSPLVHGYLVQNLNNNLLLRFLDAGLRVLTSGGKRGFPVPKPRRILLCNMAHMGDVLASTALLPLIKELFPEARIGFLIGSWSMPIIKGHPMIDRIHCVDHWYHNRSATGRPAKISRFLKTRRAALRELREERYDTALDLYYHIGNAIPLLWSAGIPVRIGFPTGGFGPFLTHTLAWEYGPTHVAQVQARLLGFLASPTAGLPVLRYSMPQAAVAGPEADPSGTNGEYVVFHMGTGVAIKEWPLVKWKELAQRVNALGVRLRFTGLGAREDANAETVLAGLEGCENWCNKLGWDRFLGMLRESRAIVCADSLSAHLGAMFGRPLVVLSTGINNPRHWRPLGDNVAVKFRPVPCSPCFRSGGCEGMECIRELSVDEVFASALETFGLAAKGKP